MGREIIKNKNYIASYGAGINSTAMLLLILKEKRSLDRIIFADTGGEYPETYSYLKIFEDYLLKNHNLKVETVRAKNTLLEYCESHHILPSFRMRFCTDLFKIRPMREAMTGDGSSSKDRKFIVYLGIDAGENQRARSSPYPDTENTFPLIDAGIDREGCLKIIEEAGLPAPKKSGCWFCFYQKNSQLIELDKNHPELIARIEALEIDVNREYNNREKPFYLFDRPIRDRVEYAKGRALKKELAKDIESLKNLQREVKQELRNLEIEDEEAELKRPCLCAFN